MDPVRIGASPPFSITANIKFYLNLEKELNERFPYLVFNDGILSVTSKDGYSDPVNQDALQARLIKNVILKVKGIESSGSKLFENVEKIAAIFYAQIQPLVGIDIHKKSFHIQIFTALLEYHMKSYLNGDVIDLKRPKRASGRRFITLTPPESSSESSSPKRGSPRSLEETQIKIANLSTEGLNFFRVHCLFQYTRTKMDDYWEESITVAEHKRIQEVLHKQNIRFIVQAQVSRAITPMLGLDSLAGCINRTLSYVSIYSKNEPIFEEAAIYSNKYKKVFHEKHLRFSKIINHLIHEMKFNNNEMIYIGRKFRDAFKEQEEYGPDTFKDLCKNFLTALDKVKAQDHQLLQALLIMSQHTYNIPGMAIREAITDFPLEQGRIHLCYRFLSETNLEFQSRIVFFPKLPSKFFEKKNPEDAFEMVIQNTLFKNFRENKLWSSTLDIQLKLPNTLTKEEIKNSVIKPLKSFGFSLNITTL